MNIRTAGSGYWTPKSAKAAQDAQLTAAFEAAAAVLPNEAAARLRMIRGNQRWSVPAAYKVVERTDAQWVALRQALASRRINTERGHSVPGAVTSLLSSVESDGAVSTALTATMNNVGPVRAIWYSTFGVH